MSSLSSRVQYSFLFVASALTISIATLIFPALFYVLTICTVDKAPYSQQVKSKPVPNKTYLVNAANTK